MESIKIAYAVMVIGTTDGVKFNMSLAPDEIIHLKALHYIVSPTAVVPGTNVIRLALYRKSDKNPISLANNEEDSDIVWRTLIIKELALNQSMTLSQSEMIHFPQPLILIRPPRLITEKIGLAGVIARMRLYYTIKNATKNEIAKLMLKDHD